MEPKYGDCTCCNPPRAMTLTVEQQPNGEWMHDDDETYAEVFHVHSHEQGSSCDGPVSSSHTYQITSLVWRPGELSFKTVEEPDKHDLWTKLAKTAAPLYRDCQLKVETQDDGTCLLTWSAPTDEGYESGQLQGCVDPDCAHDGSSQRDVFAEQMGY